VSPRVAFALAGLLGGACWVARAFVAPEPLRWAGLVLIGLCLAGAGASMVKAAWLRALVAVAFPVLVWSVVEVFHDSSEVEDVHVDAVAGGLMVVIALVVLARSLRARPARGRSGERRSTGSHAR
jgi:zinc transporter ZupT